MLKNQGGRTYRKGDKIWHYQIDDFLGKGAFGNVYLAHHTAMTRRIVAIKQLSVVGGDQSVVKRFIQESYAMGELHHPNVVLIFELIEPDKYPDVDSYFIVMEYMDGGTLQNWMEDPSKTLTLADKIRITREVCQGLAVAHQEGIFHRDIKPANILMSSDGSRVKIGDWGLAHVETQGLTVVGDVLGTLDYMPPEQAAGYAVSVDGRADLYSVGAMFYELVTGHHCINLDEISHQVAIEQIQKNPLMNRTRLNLMVRDAIFEAIQTYPRTDPRMFVPDISDNLRSVMQKSIAIRAEQRYQSAEEFIIALDSVTAQLGPKVRPTTTSNENISRVAALLVQSRQCRQERDYEEAIKLLEEAKKIVPGDAGVCLELGRIFNLIGRQQDAVRVLCEALAENPDNYVLLRDLGITYMGLKDSAKALEMLDQSLKLNPNQPRVLALVKRLKK